MNAKIISIVLLSLAGVSAQAQVPPVKTHPAVPSSIASQATMLGSTWAGNRAVAVGERGVVLLSDDGGSHWRQARKVPVSFTLTAVSFPDPKQGWAVGHGGVVLKTEDGGETWAVQRMATDTDRPLFSVLFRDHMNGVAVGLWSTVLTTSDGGKTWTDRPLSPPPGMKGGDLNLFSLFFQGHGAIVATAERGVLLRSNDMGQTWSPIPTGYGGSLWCGQALADGSLLVGGQRGTLLVSRDDGQSWTHLDLQTKSSITTIVGRDKEVWVGGLDGFLAKSADLGHSFDVRPQSDGVSLTSLLMRPQAAPVLFSRRGVVTPK